MPSLPPGARVAKYPGGSLPGPVADYPGGSLPGPVADYPGGSLPDGTPRPERPLPPRDVLSGPSEDRLTFGEIFNRLFGD
jgi:hypothetical protein